MARASVLIGVDSQLARELIRVHEAEAGRFEVGLIECGLAGTVGPSYRDDDRAHVEERGHVRQAGRNTRFTNRPTVRFPSASPRCLSRRTLSVRNTASTARPGHA